MTRLKQLALGGLAAFAITSVASTAFANEAGTFQNRLQGATIGLPLGALPPPGLYSGLETAYLGMANFGHGGGTTGNWSQLFGGHSNGLPAIAQAAPLLFVPGWNFLGASYSMSAVVAFYEAAACPQNAAGAVINNCQFGLSSQFVFANPTWNPINLSWNLGGGWFASFGFNFMAPIGSNYVGTPNPDYWTLEPTFAVSYLGNNWVLSANFFYDINTVSHGPCCILGANAAGDSFTNGQLLYGDFTGLYKFGKWEFGPVGYFEVQTTPDQVSGPGSAALCATFCGSFSNVALGALVGYDFGPVDLQFWLTDVVESRDSPAGVGALFLWTRLGFKIWGPSAPPPLVSKN
jgi:hypothetical protein